MLHYCEFMGFVFDELKFLYDGKKVKPENTAQDFKMEDGDTIVAVSDMLGGGGGGGFLPILLPENSFPCLALPYFS
ncbi:hypothetical protein SLE2022_123560 [Rubroshorea leprosula]